MVAHDAALKKQVREIVEEEERINYAKRMGEKWVNDLKAFKTTWSKPYLDTAPYLVFVFKQTYGLLPSGERRVHYYNEISVCISTGLLLAAIQVFMFLIVLLCSHLSEIRDSGACSIVRG